MKQANIRIRAKTLQNPDKTWIYIILATEFETERVIIESSSDKTFETKELAFKALENEIKRIMREFENSRLIGKTKWINYNKLN